MPDAARGARDIKLDTSWLQHLRGEFDQDYMVSLRQFLQAEKAAGKQI